MGNILKIKDIADKYNLTTRTVRFWEEKGLIEPIFRTVGKRRIYSESVGKVIKEIFQLKEKGMSLEDIKEILDKKKRVKKDITDKVRIVVDSTSSIGEDILQKYKLDLIPLYILMNKDTYLDGINISEEDFFKKVEENKRSIEISTEPPTEEDFFNLYSELVEQGAQTIYSIHISEVFSKTIVNARKAAAQFTKVKFYIIDSKTSGQAITMLAMSIREKIQSGLAIEKINKDIESLIANHWFAVTVTSLKTLNMLGLLNININNSFGDLIDQILNFRPVMISENGSPDFKITHRADTMELALNNLEAALKKRVKESKLKLKMIGISHSRLDDVADRLKTKLGKEYGVPVLLQKGSVILCAHLGPMSLGINLLFEE